MRTGPTKKVETAWGLVTEMSGDSVILGGDFDYEQPFYQPPIMVQSALSVGLNKHITLKGNSVTEENSRRQAAQKRAKQDAYRAMLDADRVASIPVSRRPAQFPSPQVEATGFMIGRQEEVSPERKKEMQAQWKQELAQYAALPSIQAERRPFPHRAYTPAMSIEQRNSIDGLEDAALAELLAKRAEVRRRLTQDRSDVIHQLSPNDSSPLKLSFRQPPVGGKALDSASKKVFTISPGLEPTTGLAIGPDIKQEKLNSLQKNASFMVNVRRDLELKASQKAAEDERNLAILFAGRQGQGQGQGQLTGMVRSPSKLAEQFVDYEGNTSILIGGETMDMARSGTAAERKRQQTSFVETDTRGAGSRKVII